MPISRVGFTAAAAACAIFCLAPAASASDRRELNLHNANTGEDLRVVYKNDGLYDKAALRKLEWFFRDWRLSKTTTMDPRLFDLLERVYAETGSDATIVVHSGYRSAQTNAMLRSRSPGVARESQHIEGKAIDFHIPGVPTKKLREIALKVQGGGVGYYPTSRSPFVHIDVADVRSWPRPSREYLASLFPDGKTMHIPSDGRPLPRYEEAKAEITGRKLGILAVIGDIKTFVSGKHRPAAATATETAFMAPIPARRPAVDPATAFMHDPASVMAYAATPKARPELGQTTNAFADVLLRRQQLRAEMEALHSATGGPIVFKTAQIGKSGRTVVGR
nr:DUF882 domain-containing protein [Neorhizobium tomejilense]